MKSPKEANGYSQRYQQLLRDMGRGMESDHKWSWGGEGSDPDCDGHTTAQKYVWRLHSKACSKVCIWAGPRKLGKRLPGWEGTRRPGRHRKMPRQWRKQGCQVCAGNTQTSTFLEIDKKSDESLKERVTETTVDSRQREWSPCLYELYHRQWGKHWTFERRGISRQQEEHVLEAQSR